MSLLIPPEIASINDVIKAARHSNWVLLRAADVKDMPKSAKLRTAADARDSLADALSDLVLDLDQAPPAKDPPGESDVLEAVWTDLRAGLSGDPTTAALEQCQKADAQLVETAEMALKEPDLPSRAKDLITPITDGHTVAIDWA
jgi:hypothetical protein